MSVTIKTIAEKCGVSRGTVDRVINNRGRVSEQTAKKVRAVAEELGYTPNTLGRELAARGKRLCIGIILCSLDNPFYDEMIRGIEDAIEENRKYGITVVIRHMKTYDAQKQIELMDELAEIVNCLIINAIDDKSIADRIDELKEEGISVFTVNTDISGSKRVAHIGVNVAEYGRIACGLIGLMCGKQANVLITIGSFSLLEHRARVEGFRDTIHSRYPEMKILDVLETQDDDEEAYRVVWEFLQNSTDVDAFCVASGGISGICRVLKELDINNIRVVACDVIPDTVSLMEEGIIQATIDQQPWMQGYQAVSVAVKYLISGKTAKIIEIENQVKLFENIR